MTLTVRYGLRLAARPSSLFRPSPRFPCLPPSASAVRRAYRFHSALHTSAAASLPEDDYNNRIAAEDMDNMPDSQETASSQSSLYADPDAAPLPRPDALKPGDSFGSEFYGELNGISIDPSENHGGTNVHLEAGAVQHDAEEEQATSGEETDVEPPLELTFKRKPIPPSTDSTETAVAVPPSFWSHLLYEGPAGEDVTVHYCHTLEDSEAVAQLFLNEPVLGFDMEWYPYASEDNIKMNVSVVQLACQGRIAIFHLARHEGFRREDILSPSLRTIIESEKNIKAGVSINKADAPRLRKYLLLEPKGLFELSHLYNLVENVRAATGYISRLLKRLDEQVTEKLGMPLDKGPVRMSNWTKPLNQTQLDYAAADAYASFMLFHIMNEERKRMKPTPRLPAFAERALPIIGIPEVDGGGPPEDSAVAAVLKSDGPSRGLFKALCDRRDAVAAVKGVRASSLASNQALARIAIEQPRTLRALQAVKGVGIVTIENFGGECVSIVELFLRGEIPSASEADLNDSITSGAREKQKGARLNEYEQALYDRLSKKRAELVKERGLPSSKSFIIASNRVLESIARERPSNDLELAKISGIGPYTLQHFGMHWLSVINEFLSEHPELMDVGLEGMPSVDEAFEALIANLPPGAERYLEGEQVVFTGILDMLGRTTAYDFATRLGAQVMERPTPETTMIVTGRDVSENKLRIIAESGIKSLAEQDFVALVLRKARAASRAVSIQERAQAPLPGLSALVGSTGSGSTRADEDVPKYHRPFYNALTAFRTQLASISKLPAASICSDTDLRTIALARPARRANILRLPGGKGFDKVAQRCNKSIDAFLLKYNKPIKASTRAKSTES